MQKLFELKNNQTPIMKYEMLKIMTKFTKTDFKMNKQTSIVETSSTLFEH